ncbi:unnamed protein product [Closterium sp. NIES-54]
MWQLDQQEQQQRQLQPQKPPLLQQLFPPVSGLRALGLPSAPPVRSQSPTAYGPTTVLFRSSRHRAPPVCVLPPPRASSLTVSTHPITDYYRAARPVVSRVLASLVTDPHASRSSFSALIAAVADLSSTRRLDIATRVVAALPARPLSSRVPPRRANVVDGMWIFKVKRPPGLPSVFKARYVARDFSQCEEVDFCHTFAATPKMTTLRGTLYEETWLRPPLGFFGTIPLGTQWKMRRPVYGLRQAPREWHNTLRTSSAALGFRPSSADPSLFACLRPTPFFVLAYVNDSVFATANSANLAEVKPEPQKRHTSVYLGELRRYLGLQITRDRANRTITLSHSDMVQQVLQRVAKYLATTSGMGLVLGGRLSVVLTSECDSFYADDMDDAAAHGRAAPLLAPHSAAGRLGSQLPGAVGAAARDDAVPAVHHDKARHVVFYENMSLEVWKSEHGPASGRTPTTPPTDTLTATLPLLAEVGEPPAEDVEDVSSPSPSPTPPVPPLVAELRRLTPASASGDEGSSEASPKAPTKSIAGGHRDVQQVDMRVLSTPAGEEQTKEVQPTMVRLAKGAAAWQQLTWEQAAAKPTTEHSGSDDSDDGGEAEESTDCDVVEVQGGPRRTGRLRRPPDFFVPAAFTTVYNVDADDLAYDNAEDDDELPELNLDMHTDPEHRWHISTMTVKEALASWKGVAVKAAMEEEIRSLIGMGTWELVERPPEVYGADYDKTYTPVSSYVTLRFFLSIVVVLNLNLMQLDMKNAFLQSKLDQVACWVLVYVDDLLAASSSTEMLKELKELLEAAFKLREISPVQKYLGLEIVRDSEPESLKMVGYVDADDAGDKQNRRRTGGYVFVYRGAAVSLSSQRIKCVTLSSIESEYVAATKFAKEGRRLRFLLAEFRQLDAETPRVLQMDNKSAITVAEGMGLTGNLKHMERRQAWLQHMVKRGNFLLRYIPTAEQPDTFLTKALHYPALNRCSVKIGQLRLADVGDGRNDVQQ